MVRIYTWHPTDLSDVVGDRLLPDVGHLALELVGDDGSPRSYASFWPERDSLIGRLTRLWKPRRARHPETYVEECDPDGAFMQRPADHVDEVSGLEEAAIVELWPRLRESAYDLAEWNCIHVGRVLFLSAIPRTLHRELEASGLGGVEELAFLGGEGDARTGVRLQPTGGPVEHRLEDVRRLAHAYLGWRRGDAPSAGEGRRSDPEA